MVRRKPVRDYLPASGQLTLPPGYPQSFTVTTLDHFKYEGKETVLLQLSAPMGANLGIPPVANLAIQDNDPYDAALFDDFEMPPYQFTAPPTTVLSNLELTAGSPRRFPGRELTKACCRPPARRTENRW